MSNTSCHRPPRHCARPRLAAIGAAAALAFVGVIVTAAAPQFPVRLNRVIERLEQGRPAFGAIALDRSLDTAQVLARSDLDWVFIDMEHGSMDFQDLRAFLVGMTDKAAILRKGNLQPNVTPIVRLPQYGREPLQFMVKQALDLGVFGIIFPAIESREQALNAVRAMRYPQRKGSRDMEPAGQRGSGAANAIWYWGVTPAEYDQRADLWPLDPAGELLAIMMIESAEGLKHADEIMAVPGVSMMFFGPGDMSHSLGVGSYAQAVGGVIPEVEAAAQTVLKACISRKVPCGITANASDVATRIQQGFRFFSLGGGGGLSPATDAALRAGRAAEP